MRAEMVIGLALLCLGSCRVDERKGYVSERDHFSMMELDGWTEKRERDTVVFVGDAEQGLQRTTIAVRSVPVKGDWVDERTAERVVPAAATVLSSLPEAKVAAPEPIARRGFRGASFELTFSPRSKPGQRYQRRHVVLVGKRRVLHVVHTAPVGDLQHTAELFEAVVDSMREEA